MVDPELESKEKDSNQNNNKDESSFKKKDIEIVESLLILFKLKFLRRSVDLTGETAVLSQLEAKALKGTEEEKEEAVVQISKLFQQVVEIQQGVDQETELAALVGARAPAKTQETAMRIDAGMKVLREQLRTGVVNEQQIEQMVVEIKDLGEQTGVELEEPERAKQLMEQELAELEAITKKTMLLKQRISLKREGGKEPKTWQESTRTLLEEEDLKDQPDSKKRKLRIVKGGDRERNQQAVDKQISRFKKDVPRLERMSDEELISGIEEMRELAKQSLKCGSGIKGIEEAYELAFRMGEVYTEVFADRVVREVMNKGGKAKNPDVAKIWLKTMSMERIRTLWVGKRGRSGKLELAGEIENLMNEMERQYEFVKELGKTIDDGQEEIEQEHRLLRGRRAREFAEMGGAFGGENGRLYERLEQAKRGDNPDLYLKTLISYLAKVGLREGLHDMNLTNLMTQARGWLADKGEHYLHLFKGFELLAQFHDQFAMISGAEDMARIQKGVKMEPLQAWFGHSADKLNVMVELGEGNERSLAAWKFRDMMETEEWAHKLIYTAEIDEEKMYDQMMFNQLFGGGEYRVVGGVLQRRILTEQGQLENWERVEEMSREIVVDGGKIKLEEFVRDNRWMAMIAHDAWKVTGRWANVLDSVQIGKAKLNKNLLAIYHIRRYCEEYGIVPPYLYEAISLDGFIYSFENYKDMTGKGLNNLMMKADYIDLRRTAVDRKPIVSEEAGKVVGIINDHLKSIRTMRGKEYRTNNISLEDARLLGVAREDWTYERAKEEYLRRQKVLGKKISAEDLESDGYKRQIEFMWKKWERAAMTREELQTVRALDWGKINREYEKMLGVEAGSLGNTFPEFIKNFSFLKTYDYHAARDSDLENYGKYFMLAEKVVGVFKNGFKGASTEGLLEALGTMRGYLSYASSGFKDYMAGMLGSVFDLRRIHTGIYEYAAVKEDSDLDGDKLNNGEFLVDENGYWVSDKNEDGTNKQRSPLTLVGQSVLSKDMGLKTLRERDVEYSMLKAVALGVIAKEDAEQFLNDRYGGLLKRSKYGAKFWRWMKRSMWFDSPYFLIDAALEDGGNALKATLKHIFS